MIGRPSQPDLDNTSVGKPGEIGSCEEFSRVPGLWEGGFFYCTNAAVSCGLCTPINHERISL